MHTYFSELPRDSTGVGENNVPRVCPCSRIIYASCCLTPSHNVCSCGSHCDLSKPYHVLMLPNLTYASLVASTFTLFLNLCIIASTNHCRGYNSEHTVWHAERRRAQLPLFFRSCNLMLRTRISHKYIGHVYPNKPSYS